jgi:hypothetical protein
VLTSASIEFILTVILTEIIPAAIFLYAAYWSLEIRRALASPIYRNHALLQGATTIILAAGPILTYGTNLVTSLMIAAFYTAFFAIIFAFIDSSIKVARRSDPLLRSIMKWQTIRYAGWLSIVVLAFLNFYGAFNPTAASITINILLYNLFIAIPFVIGGPALLIGAKRSRDPILRGNLKWLGLALVFAVLFAVVDAVGFSTFGLSNFQFFYTYDALPGGVLWILIGLAFYKSARSLSPVSHFPLDEVKQSPL